MQQFVVIFRQEPREFTAAELEERTRRTRTWAGPLNAAGHRLVPRILGREIHWSGPNGAIGPAPAHNAGTVSALLFLEAQNFAQAVAIARSHPAVDYGACVEVRTWAEPPVGG